MATFESQNRRMPKIEACLKANGLESLDACNEMLLAKGIDCDKIIRGIQPICFDNAVWAYTLGTAIAVKRGLKSAADCAAAIGEGLEAFTIPGSVAEQRKVGLGHGNLSYVHFRAVAPARRYRKRGNNIFRCKLVRNASRFRAAAYRCATDNALYRSSVRITECVRYEFCGAFRHCHGLFLETFANTSPSTVNRGAYTYLGI